MQQQDTPHDALVHLLQLLPQADRVRLSAVSTAWLRAAAETFKDVDAKLDNMKALALHAWLKRHGGQVEMLSVRSCEPSSVFSNFIIEKDPVDEASVELPCTSLHKLRTLRLYNIDVSFEGVTDDTTHNPFPSLTSLKAYESQYVNPYLHMLTSLKQLSLSRHRLPNRQPYEDGHSTHTADTPARGVDRRRRLGVQAYTHPYGFSRNSRHYEPDSIGFDEDMYEQATAAAFTEDVTFLFAGLPALQELEMGCYTDVGRGEEALSRKLRCGPVAGVAAPHGAASGAAARAGRVRGLGLGLGRPPAAAAGAPAQRLTALKVVNALDIDGIQNMLLPNLTTLTRLKLSVADMHSLDGEEACMLVYTLPALRKQLANLDIGSGLLTYGLPEDVYLPFAGLTALTSLAINSDAQLC